VRVTGMRMLVRHWNVAARGARATGVPAISFDMAASRWGWAAHCRRLGQTEVAPAGI